MVKFIDDNRDDFGVEPICGALQVASSTYYDNRNVSRQRGQSGMR
jgi:hypothetical protein